MTAATAASNGTASRPPMVSDAYKRESVRKPDIVEELLGKLNTIVAKEQPVFTEPVVIIPPEPVVISATAPMVIPLIAPIAPVIELKRPQLDLSAHGDQLVLRHPKTQMSLMAVAKKIGGKWSSREQGYLMPLYIHQINQVREAYRFYQIEVSDAVTEWEKGRESELPPMEPWLQEIYDKLFPYQKIAVGRLVDQPWDHPGELEALSPGLGKAQRFSDFVLTLRGWKKFGNIVVGDKVVGSNGKETTVTGIFPRGKLAVYRVTFNDGSYLDTAGDHLWTVFSTRRFKNRGVTYEKVASTLELKNDLFESDGHKSWQIPMVEPVQFPEKDLPFDPYVMGVWLGDGSKSETGVFFTPGDVLVPAEVAALLPIGAELTECSKPERATQQAYRISSVDRCLTNDIRDYLRNEGLLETYSYERFIPKDFLYGSVEQRIDLLQGLMDTDGSYEQSSSSKDYSTTNFNTSSEKLAKQVQFLVQSLGGTARLNIKQPYYTYNGERKVGRTAYRINICLPDTIRPFRVRHLEYKPTKFGPRRFIKSITKLKNEEEMICIAVEAADQLYVTRSCIVTHNTIVAITSALILGLDRVLVIAPLSLVSVWMMEWAKWLGHVPANKRPVITPAHGNKPAKTGWVVTNYNTVSSPRLCTDFLEEEWDLIIVDESVLIKNRKTQRFLNIKNLRESADRVWLLSGSPITKQPDDLWSQMNLIDAKAFPSYHRFTERYCVLEDNVWARGQKVVGSAGRNLPEEFRDIMFVKNQEEVLADLPEMRDETIPCKMSQKQEQVYVRMLKQFVARLENPDSPELEANAKMSQLIRLQQIVSNVYNLNGKDFNALNPPWPDLSGKDETLLDLLESGAIEFPLLVWTHWTPSAHALYKKMLALKLDVERISGGMPTEQVDETFNSFKSGNLDILILSLGVGKFGHTMTKTRTIVYKDKTWDADAYVQSRYRVRRIGLTHSPRVISLYCAGTVDDMVEDNLAGKLPSIANVTNSNLAKLLRGINRGYDL